MALLDELVGGEPVRDIIRAFPYFDSPDEKGGRWETHASVPPGEGDAFFRALLRIEAELILADAELIGTGGIDELRQPDERAADALVALCDRVLEKRKA